MKIFVRSWPWALQCQSLANFLVDSRKFFALNYFASIFLLFRCLLYKGHCLRVASWRRCCRQQGIGSVSIQRSKVNIRFRCLQHRWVESLMTLYNVFLGCTAHEFNSLMISGGWNSIKRYQKMSTNFVMDRTPTSSTLIYLIGCWCSCYCFWCISLQFN